MAKLISITLMLRSLPVPLWTKVNAFNAANNNSENNDI
jgi:hypothetical protein